MKIIIYAAACWPLASIIVAVEADIREYLTACLDKVKEMNQ